MWLEEKERGSMEGRLVSDFGSSNRDERIAKSLGSGFSVAPTESRSHVTLFSAGKSISVEISRSSSSLACRSPAFQHPIYDHGGLLYSATTHTQLILDSLTDCTCAALAVLRLSDARQPANHWNGIPVLRRWYLWTLPKFFMLQLACITIRQAHR
jgi:hypothetical protein